MFPLLKKVTAIIVGSQEIFLLENRIFNAITSSLAFIALIILISNIVLGLGTSSIVTAGVALIIFFLLYCISRRRGPSQITSWIFVVSVCVIVAVECLLITGYFGYMFLLALAFVCILAMYFSGKQLLGALGLLAFIISVIFLVKTTNPSIINEMDLTQNRVKESYFIFMAVGTGISLMIWLIMEEYRNSRKKIQELNESLATTNQKLQYRNAELEIALREVKTLSGLLPICASCKSIRDDKGYWNELESYISIHSEASFTHGICPDCVKKLYPELAS